MISHTQTYSVKDFQNDVHDATGGCSNNTFIDDMITNFNKTQDHMSYDVVAILDGKMALSLALGGSFAKQYGGLTVGGAAWGLFKESRSGFSVTGIGSRTFPQVAGTLGVTWLINSVLIKGSFDAGVLVGSVLRTGVNRLSSRGCECSK